MDAATLHHDRFAESIVSNIEGYCQLAKAGCPWVGKRGELHTHLARDCQHVTVACPNEGCGIELPRHALAEHLQACSACAAVECPFGCGARVVGAPAMERHQAECLLAPAKLMAAIRELARQNEQLTLENERLRESSAADSDPDAVERRARKAVRRRMGPGTSVE